MQPAVVDRGVELILIEVGVREQDAGKARGQLDRRTVDQRGALALALKGALIAQKGSLCARDSRPLIVRAPAFRFRAMSGGISGRGLQTTTN